MIDNAQIHRLATQCGVTSHHRQDKHLMESIRQIAIAAAREASPELSAIHAITLCIGCVKEVDKSAPYTVQAVQQMAVRINELEKIGGGDERL